MENILNVPEKKFTPCEYNYNAGEKPTFDLCKDVEKFRKKIQSVFNKDWSFNGKSEYAENYALSLMYYGKVSAAKELFDAISIERPKSLSPEGIYMYATACMRLGFFNKAINLFKQIVDEIELKCTPQRHREIRMYSISYLLSGGIKSTKKIDSLSLELDLAKKHMDSK